jgi:hypothetical protein
MKTNFTLRTMTFFLAISAFLFAACAPVDEEIDVQEIGADELAAEIGEASILTTSDSTSGPTCLSNICTETSSHSCNGFREECARTEGCGTTAVGAGDIAIVTCAAIELPSGA